MRSRRKHKLRRCLGVEDGGAGGKRAAMLLGVRGVRNKCDGKSKGGWARLAGWYVAMIGGTKHYFALLGDALRAYGALVVRKKVLPIKETDLNDPGDWSRLFDDDEEEEEEPPKKKKKEDTLLQKKPASKRIVLSATTVRIINSTSPLT